jgi:hypothetical protein
MEKDEISDFPAYKQNIHNLSTRYSIVLEGI